MTCVDKCLQALATLDISLLGGEIGYLGFESQQCFLRQAVRQMKGYMLRGLGTFKMGQISAAVPYRPGNANLPIGVFSPANREIGVPGTILRVGH